MAAAKLDWTETDDKAVDTIRVLAMDAVQKVGNGHPGTAMSLAPAAYLLFQKVMRHNPADPHWPGRDRFVLSCGHSSLTLYLQLFLGGWGLEIEDIKSLRTWGSKTPGHPEFGHTAGVETTTGPLGQGIGNAVGMAMAARRERGLLDPNAAEGDSPFDHQIYALCSDGDIEEGVSAEASSLAGAQQPRQPHADLRREQDLDRGRHRHRAQRGRRRSATRPTAGTSRSSTGPTAGGQYQRGRPRAVRRDPQGRRRSPTSRASSSCARSSRGRRPTPRTPARRTAPRSARTRSRPPRRCSASTPTRPSRSRPVCSSTPVGRSSAARPRRPSGSAAYERVGEQAVRRHGPLRPAADRHPARRLGPTRSRRSRRTRRAWRPAWPPASVINAVAATRARAVGRLGRPRRLQQHDHRGRPSFLPR